MTTEQLTHAIFLLSEGYENSTEVIEYNHDQQEYKAIYTPIQILAMGVNDLIEQSQINKTNEIFMRSGNMEEVLNWSDLDYWITKDGSHIYPEQMSDEHLSNTIQYLESHYGVVESDLNFHGEVIQHRAIGAIYGTKIYSLLAAEQEKRQAMKE